MVLFDSELDLHPKTDVACTSFHRIDSSQKNRRLGWRFIRKPHEIRDLYIVVRGWAKLDLRTWRVLSKVVSGCPKLAFSGEAEGKISKRHLRKCLVNQVSSNCPSSKCHPERNRPRNDFFAGQSLLPPTRGRWRAGFVLVGPRFFAKSFPLPKNLPLISIAMIHQRMCFSIEHEKTDS